MSGVTMSDGKKFSPKSIASAEERLTEIERKYSVIQERIQAYDAVLSEFAALKGELKGNRKTIESFVQASSTVFDELRSKIETHPAQFNILQGKAEANAKTLEDHRQLFSKYVASQNKIYNDFSEMVSKIKDQLEVAFDQKNQITNSYTETVNRIRGFKDSMDECKKCYDKFLTDYLKFKDSSEENAASQAKAVEKLTRTIAALPSLQEWSNSLYAKVQENLGYREKQATAYVDKKIDKLAKDFDANPLSAESVKTALFNEIQALALDGKNAYLKSNNCATQLALLEKKLENLNLLIKKYELNR